MGGGVFRDVRRMALEQGEEPVSEQARAESAWGAAADLFYHIEAAVEEIAATRYVLRNTICTGNGDRENEDTCTW